MIINFRHKGLKRFFETGEQRGIPAQYANQIRRQLDLLNAAKVPEDLNLPEKMRESPILNRVAVGGGGSSEDILPAAGLSQTELAARIGVSRKIISEILHERRPVTIDLAHRLARVFRTTPELWVNLQQAVDLWDELQAHKDEYEKIKPIETGEAA